MHIIHVQLTASRISRMHTDSGTHTYMCQTRGFNHQWSSQLKFQTILISLIMSSCSIKFAIFNYHWKPYVLQSILCISDGRRYFAPSSLRCSDPTPICISTYSSSFCCCYLRVSAHVQSNSLSWCTHTEHIGHNFFDRFCCESWQAVYRTYMYWNVLHIWRISFLT